MGGGRCSKKRERARERAVGERVQDKESERRASQTKEKSVTHWEWGEQGGEKKLKNENQQKEKKKRKRPEREEKNLPSVPSASEWEEREGEAAEESEDRGKERKKIWREKRETTEEEEKSVKAMRWLSLGSPLCRDTRADLIKSTPASHISTLLPGRLPDRSKSGKGRGAKGVCRLYTPTHPLLPVFYHPQAPKQNQNTCECWREWMGINEGAKSRNTNPTLIRPHLMNCY